MKEIKEMNNSPDENGWTRVRDGLPILSKAQRMPDQFGIMVQIYPPVEEYGTATMPVAFYGTRVTDKPDFYIYGRVIPNVTHWQYLPNPPKDD